jgi:hypothetical protein
MKFALLISIARALLAQDAPLCQVTRPTASFSIPYVKSPQELNSDPRSATWKRELEYPDLKTEIKAFWTDTDLYLLFVCPYRTLNVFLPPQNDKERDKLWDKDVVEMFLGDDWENIRHYREYEIAPTADWVDLAIDLDHRGQGEAWQSGWKLTARIDEKAKTWYAACQIPLKSVSEKEVKQGTKWRANLYRIDGGGSDPQRRFMCWQPTCAGKRDSNHVPENFGALIFDK